MDYTVPLVLVALALALCACAWWLHDRARVASVIAEAEATVAPDRQA